MKNITVFRLAAPLTAAFSILAATAAPMHPSIRPLEVNASVPATWWQNYLLVDSYKKPPAMQVIYKHSLDEIHPHLHPFEERLARLRLLKT